MHKTWYLKATLRENPLGKCSRRQKDNIDEGSEGVDWIPLAEVTEVVACEHPTEPSGFIKDRKFRNQLGDHQILMKDFVQRRH
jgi:hypothetical protein